MEILDLGVRPYAEVLSFQRALAADRISGALPHDVLVLVEHPPVVTLGRREKDNKLPVGAKFLASRGIELFEVERGGGVTFHGPGQLVGYPIVGHLVAHRAGHALHTAFAAHVVEEALIRGLASFDIPAERNDGFTGVWTRGRKIASIGVHARSWVTWHGFALNVTTNLSYFDLMTPCGIDGVVMTSVAKENPGAEATVADVAPRVADAFGELFTMEQMWTRVTGVLQSEPAGVEGEAQLSR